MKSLITTTVFLIFIISSYTFAATGLVWRTGFETNEGFTIGNLLGQNGWEEFVRPDSIANAYVTNAVAGGSVPEGQLPFEEGRRS